MCVTFLTCVNIHSRLSENTVKMNGLLLHPKGRWVSTKNFSFHLMPNMCHSDGFTGRSLNADCMSTFDKNAPFPISLIMFVASSKWLYCTLYSSRAMPLLTLFFVVATSQG